MSLYERIFPRWRPRRELRPRGRSVGSGVRVRWLGTAGYVVETAEATLLIDPFVSRQGLPGLARRLSPDDAAIARHIPRKVDAVLCGHSHYDHIVDAPRIAQLSGARLVGSASTCAWGRREGLPERQLVQVPDTGALVQVGDVEVRFVPSRHGRAILGRVPAPGVVHGTPRRAGFVWSYRMGGVFGLLLHAPGVTLYHNGSADLLDAELDGERADVLLACLAGRQHTDNYVGRLVSALSPSLVVPSHHDAFFAPLERGLHLLPGIDVEGFVSEVHLRSSRATVITPDYLETIAIPSGDARGAVIEDDAATRAAG